MTASNLPSDGTPSDRVPNDRVAAWLGTAAGVSYLNTVEADLGGVPYVIATHPAAHEVLYQLNFSNDTLLFRACVDRPGAGATIDGIPGPLWWDDAGAAAKRARLGVPEDQLRKLISTAQNVTLNIADAARLYLHENADLVSEEIAEAAGHRPISLRELDALSTLVESDARMQAALDINVAFVRLDATPTPRSFRDPQALGRAVDDKAFAPVPMAENLSDHWRATYRQALRDTLDVIAAEDTPSEQAMYQRQEWQDYIDSQKHRSLGFPDHSDDKRYPPGGPQPPHQPGDGRGTGPARDDTGRDDTEPGR